ncbi:DUF6414 family protein [Sporolactobacillus nakayamae]|uniref:Uncharacterized protein n=1 Tax=Sporolactobacillus nakayamae TaxID=269670 RepID=A0A1I2P075_9BACL|nr:hypothetical protein [Sporolactobacillus nakayamae]SFG09542.1 hypothetical protein SAMN02982927_00653 [Sporolactobacillus nakayamae]
MKEIVYLDINLINSVLAQLNGSVPTTVASEVATAKEVGQATSSQKVKNSEINAQMVVGAKLARQTVEGETTDEKILDSQKDIMNKIFHDHLLDVLIDNLQGKIRQDNTNTDFREGDFLFTESAYNFYDFEMINKLTNMNSMSGIFNFGKSVEEEEEEDQIRKLAAQKITNNQAKNQRVFEARQAVKNLDAGINNINLLHNISSYFAEAFRNKAIIQYFGNVGIIDKQFLREPPESIVLRTDQNRKVKVLSRLIGLKEHITQEDELQKLFNGASFEINRIPSIFFDLFLSPWGIIHEGDRLVTPIAIFYE